MDAINPVGAMVQPPQQINPLQTYSGILGLQQQQIGLQQAQQNLETGRAVQQQEQSAAQLQQEQMSERQKLQAAMQSGKDDLGNPLKDQNGEVIPDALVSYARRALPIIGNQVAQSILTTQSNKTSLQSAVADLQQKLRTQLGNSLKGFYGSNASSKEINAQIDNLAKQNPDMLPAAYWAKTLTPHLDAMQGPQRDQALSHLVGLLTGESPQTPTSVDTGGAIQPGTTNVASGVFTPSGTSIGKTLSPQVVTPPGGIPAVIGGAAGSKVPSPGAPSGPAPTDQDWQNFGAYNSDLNRRVQIATDAIPRIHLTEQALQAIRSGAGSQTLIGIAQRLQAIGAPQELVDAVGTGNLADAQVAEKMLFQTTMTGLRQAMQGDSAHVAEFQAAESVFPKIGTDPRASREILQFMESQGQRDYAEQQALNSSRKGGTFNPVTWQSDYQSRLRAGQVPGSPENQNPKPSGTAEGTKSTSKSGKPIIYRNGRWEYQ